LSGKYRPNGDVIDTPRRETALQYLNHHGIAVLAALDVIAAEHGVSDAAVALAWLAAQPTVLAPIASARNPEQLADLLPMAELKLSAAELEQLDVVSRT
jgi:aryl-alcohol dehydrogenase-like predicted oxidoreductase